VEALVRRRENIYSIDEYSDILNKSVKSPKPVVTSMNDKMCDVSEIQRMRGIKKAVINTEGNKVELRDKVRWIKVTKFGCYQYRHSFSNSEPWKEVNIQSLEFDGVLESMNDMSGIQLPVIPSSKHDVKKCKIQDIQKQLEFIPAIYRGYYEKVIQQNMANEDDDNNTELFISDNDLSHDNDEQEVSSALVCKRIKWFASVLLMLCCTVSLAGESCTLPH